jgi:serine/threonine protein kinase
MRRVTVKVNGCPSTLNMKSHTIFRSWRLWSGNLQSGGCTSDRQVATHWAAGGSDPRFVTHVPSLVKSDRDPSDVGTELYMAPEVMRRTSRVPPQERFKADVYSLGVVFFEMNYFFNTAAERINVLGNLREPGIFFPDDWDPLRTRQQQSGSSNWGFHSRV